jgi:hypothetical protein
MLGNKLGKLESSEQIIGFHRPLQNLYPKNNYQFKPKHTESGFSGKESWTRIKRGENPRGPERKWSREREGTNIFRLTAHLGIYLPKKFPSALHLI